MIPFVHRALVTASAAGLLGRSLAGVRIRAGRLGAIVDHDPRSRDRAPDLFVAVDDGSAEVPPLTAPLALVVSSPVAAALVADDTAAAPNALEAWKLARAWASARRGDAVAPPVTPERLVAIAGAAAASGLVVVEPELPPPLSRLRATFPRPIDRAVLATIARGALARPVLFVPASRAPKVLKPRADAIGWVRASVSAPAGEEALVAAAIDVLRERAAPVAYKEVLREARSRVGSASSTDAARLASALERLSHDGVVELYAVDPEAPGWDLVTGS